MFYWCFQSPTQDENWLKKLRPSFMHELSGLFITSAADRSIISGPFGPGLDKAICGCYCNYAIVARHPTYWSVTSDAYTDLQVCGSSARGDSDSKTLKIRISKFWNKNINPLKHLTHEHLSYFNCAFTLFTQIRNSCAIELWPAAQRCSYYLYCTSAYDGCSFPSTCVCIVH